MKLEICIYLYFNNKDTFVEMLQGLRKVYNIL